MSESYKTDDIDSIDKTYVVGSDINTNLVSETFYKGDKGDEVADYSYNIKRDSDHYVKSTSVFYYEESGTQVGRQRAIDAGYDTAMIESDSFKYNARSMVDDDSDPSTPDTEAIDETKLTSTTFYEGEKGDEVAEYSYGYNLASDTKKTETYYYYGA